jgi:hypothetical protein
MMITTELAYKMSFKVVSYMLNQGKLDLGNDIMHMDTFTKRLYNFLLESWTKMI